MKVQNKHRLRLILACCSWLLHPTAQAKEGCQDLLINFLEPTDLTQQGYDSSRKVTAVLPCDPTVGAPTVLHFLERSGDQVCVSERTCGNVWAWSGSFGLAVGWSDLTLLRDFHLLRNSLRYTNDWNGSRIVASFALRAGQIERDCSELSPPTCVSVFK